MLCLVALITALVLTNHVNPESRESYEDCHEPSKKCEDELNCLCSGPVLTDMKLCNSCVAEHQHPLRQATCNEADSISYCPDKIRPSTFYDKYLLKLKDIATKLKPNLRPIEVPGNSPPGKDPIPLPNRISHCEWSIKFNDNMTPKSFTGKFVTPRPPCISRNPQSATETVYWWPGLDGESSKAIFYRGQCDLTQNSNLIKVDNYLTPINQLTIGMAVLMSTNLPNGTEITQIDLPNNQIYVSANATKTVSNELVLFQSQDTDVYFSIAQPVWELLPAQNEEGWMGSPLVFSGKNLFKKKDTEYGLGTSLSTICNNSPIEYNWNNQPGVWALSNEAVDTGGSIFDWGFQTLAVGDAKTCGEGGDYSSQKASEVLAINKQSILQSQWIERRNKLNIARPPKRQMTYFTIPLNRLTICCELYGPYTVERGSPDDYFIIWYGIQFVAPSEAELSSAIGTGAWFDSSNNLITAFSGSPGASDVDTVLKASQPLSLVFVNPLYQTQIKVPDTFMREISPFLDELEKYDPAAELSCQSCNMIGTATSVYDPVTGVYECKCMPCYKGACCDKKTGN